MSKPYWRLFAFLLIVALVGFVSPTQGAGAKEKAGGAVTKPVKQHPAGVFKPFVTRSARHDTSIPLRDMKPLPLPVGGEHERRNLVLPKAMNSIGKSGKTISAAAVQNVPAPPNMPGTFQNFEGSANACTCFPPDTNGSVGTNNYVQTVNIQYQVWDKSGNSQLGPININTIWSSFGGVCQTHNDGDPVVQYDALADRWVIMQFAIFGVPEALCVAVSSTSDPTGAWNRYEFDTPGGQLPDYPKLGVWPDAYYLTSNQFDPNTFAYVGAGVYALERDQMIAGNNAQFVYFDLNLVNNFFGNILPASLDGPPPPAGTPNTFIEWDDDSFGVPTDQLSLWDFHVDWVTPANSTFGTNGNPDLVLQTISADSNLCNYSGFCIPQPGTSTKLDALSDRLMHRDQFRYFGGYSTIVGNHTVDLDGTDHAGIDWFELRNDGSGWVVHQEGIYGPDSENRWMGSVAMDSAGNIALGYSVSSSATFPSIRYNGRLASSPAGQLDQGEASIMIGTGSQTGVDGNGRGRWGDYSNIAVDPTPGFYGGIGCDFWYTQEYIQTTGLVSWQTRVGSFSFAAQGLCGGPTGTLTGHVEDSASNPIAGATVTTNPLGISTTTNASGDYTVILPVDTYDVTASKYGYLPQTNTGVIITDGGTTTSNFTLATAPSTVVSGTVTDNGGHGWPLYARIDIGSYPGGPVYTNPVTGQYSVTLVQGTTYAFSVNAVSAGYLTGTRNVSPAGATQTEDFALDTNPSCSAPGYEIVGGVNENFDAGTQPAGWTVIDNAGTGQTWLFTDPEGQPNGTGGSGLYASANSDFFGPSGHQDTELRTPEMDLTGQATVHLQFDTWYYSLFDNADVDVSTDGGSSWTNVSAWTSDTQGHFDFDISGIAGNQPSVMARFHYYNAFWAWWWQVDNVSIGTPVCTVIPGGLMVGNVRDENTGNGLVGAAVTNDADPDDTTTTFATPDDPNVDDGFYILFSPPGPQSFTATKSLYSPDTQAVTIAADAVTPQSFNLGTGFFVVTPNPLEDTVDLGSTDTIQLHVANTGSGSASFELKEGKGHTNAPIRLKKESPVIRINGEFLPWRHGFRPASKSHKVKPEVDKGKLENGEPALSAWRGPKDAPWTDIANYPSSIMDNTCAMISDKVYCVGGYNGSSNLSSGEVYDPSTDSWAGIASMSVVREKPAAASVNDLLYVVGGWDNSGNPSPVLEIYDPSSDSWTTGSSIPTAHAAATAVNLNDQLYVIGGCTAFNCGVTDVWVYDPSSDSWSSAAAYPEPTSWLACGQIGGLIYCAGGVQDAGESQHTYVYDASTDSWTQLANMPQTQWGMGYTTSDDLLYISGGVTNQFQTVTNAGFVYDPAADAWSPIANSNNVVYRGGSSCGFYKFGGSIGGFSPVPNSEVYPGLTNCGTTDIPWLSENPTGGTVPSGGSMDVDVTFDTTVLDPQQPGDYVAHLKVKEDTPYNVPDVQVTMHVPLPATWGWLTGTVTGLGRCDAPGSPLNKATVFIDTNGNDYTIQTDASGHYQYAFPAADGPVSITVSASGYVLQTVSGVVITAQQTTTSNFDLRLDAPCGSKTPASFDVSLNANGSMTLPLTLTNTGAGSLDFLVRETTFPLPPLIRKPFPARTQFRIPEGKIGPSSIRSQKPHGAAKSAPKAPNSGWFFALPVPGGLVRYGHTQCDTSPNSYYVISGVDGTFSTTTNAWRYDALTNTWNALAPIPTASEGPAATCAQGKLYVMGGSSDGSTGGNTMFIYDIAQNTWTSGAALPRGVWGAAASSWNGQVFLIGGDADFFGSQTSDEVDVYDIASDTWIGTGSAMPQAATTTGNYQAGPFIYLAGGWYDPITFPNGTNLATTQRYDMLTDTWSVGPDLQNPRGDLAMAITDTALYTLGGDADGVGFFTSTDVVERLDYTTWPAGAWTDLGDPMPVKETANNAGFCTEAFHLGGSVSEIYSLGGVDPNFVSAGNNAFHGLSEHCYSIFSDVPWLSEAPASGTVAHDSSMDVNVTFDATGLAPGDYNAVLVVTTNDNGAPQFNIPATLHVASCMFCEEFNDTVPPSNWTYTKTWTESGGVMTSTNLKKATAVATPAFSGCVNCEVETEFSPAADARVWVYAWRTDKNNQIEALFKQANGKVIIKHRIGNVIVKKQSVPVAIPANTPLDAKMTYNGTNIVLNVNGTDIMTFVPAGPLGNGTVGYGAKVGVSVDWVHVNP